MNRFVISLLIVLFTAGSVVAADNVRAAQMQLKKDGFYFGEPTGAYDTETAAAVSRYQIRHGLPISGQLDPETSEKLGVLVGEKSTQGRTSEAWRQLRKSDEQFLKQLDAQKTSPSGQADRRKNASQTQLPGSESRALDPAPPAEGPAGSSSPDTAAPSQPPQPGDTVYLSGLNFSPERLRDYVGAFVLAGLDPQIGAELEFFADRVQYFNEGSVGREKIRADLQRYNERWPQRRFWLAGDLEVEPQPNGRLRVSFPLRYELRNRSKKSSGQVRKTLTLEPAGDDFQIIAVDERKNR